MAGLKPTFKNFINRMQIKQEVDPYILFLMNEIYDLLEDVYSVSSISELQEAIDAIGTGAGSIFIAAGTYEIDTAIDIDNCGSLVIYGHGDNTILEAAAGTTVFNITCTQRCLIRTLKIDVNNYNPLAPNTQAVVVNETNNNIVAFEDVTIDGDSSNGIGIELQSNNCIIDQCNITDCKKGVYVNSSNKHTITSNTITGHADYGIHVSSGNYLTLSTNTCGTNGDYGIYLDTVTYSTISSNICNSNTKTGIYCDSCTNNTITNNSSNSNSENGIYITGSSYNTISSNTLNSNDSSSVSDTAGLYITSNSDYNTVSGNNVNNNNNSGVGIGYGIYIAAATCNENVVASNNANGNDVDYQDSGTATTIEYYVQNIDELQDAIDSIGSKAGVITIDSSFTVSTTIDIDGGGSYTISGEGSNSTLTVSGDISCFAITSARSVLLRNFKIDASSLTTATKEIININEGSNNIITLDNVQITGDGTNGYGIELNSNNCRIENCTIDNVNIGINILSTDNILRGNTTNSNASYGIQLGGNSNTLSSNICNSNVSGIYINSVDYNLLNGNTANSNTQNGVSLTDADYNSINNNFMVGNDSNTANPQAGIYIDSDSNTNYITNNSILNNNNSGAGTGYGIYINNANCEKNIIRDNQLSGNDVNWKDIGTNTDIEYICTTGQEVQDAIDSIASKSGTIKIALNTITISTTIDVDGGGFYIIKGEGDGTILQPSGDDISVFKVTNASYCLFSNFKIDVSNYTDVNLDTGTNYGIWINEGSDNQIICNQISFVSDDITTFEYPIYIESDNCIIRECSFQNVGKIGEVNANHTSLEDNIIYDCGGRVPSPSAMDIDGDHNTIAHNKLTEVYGGISIEGAGNIIAENNWTDGTVGIYIEGNRNSVSDNLLYNLSTGIKTGGGHGCIISGNSIYNSTYGIYVSGNDYNTISGNTITDSTGSSLYGIYITGSANYNCIIGNNISDNNSTSYDLYGIILVNSDYNICIGNNISNNTSAGTSYGIRIYNTCNNTIIGINNLTGNDTNYLDNGIDTVLFGDDTAYAASWNGDLGTATKNAIYDIISTTITDLDGFPDELKNLVQAEIQQLENIGATTISAGQWGYLGTMSAQPLENVVEDTTPQLGGDLDLNGKNIDFPTTANISDCLDEDDMASDSATSIATQQSIKAYADTKAMIATGTYTGDGTNNREISTDLTTIKFGMVFNYTDSWLWFKFTNWGSYSLRHDTVAKDSRGVYSFSGSSFYVNDGSGTDDCNINGKAYKWIMFGGE